MCMCTVCCMCTGKTWLSSYWSYSYNSFAEYSIFEWLKLNLMTASQGIAAKSDYLEVFEVSTIMVL